VTAAEQYVALAYLVVFVLVLAWVLIIATKLQRLERALDDVCSARGAGRVAPAREVPTRSTVSEREQRVAVEAQPQ
jgi:hypothetical protein